MKKLIAASTSTVHGSGYLEYLLKPLGNLFEGIDQIVFVPYARPGGISHDAYTAIAAKAFSKLEITVKGLHLFENPVAAIHEARGIFTGGGNTFVLLDQLYKNQLIEPLKNVIANGTPYLGTSAGSNICGPGVCTTNDMPIVYPPSFDSLGVLPFYLNPHYLDPDPGSTHMGETRETRINEFHTQNSVAVLGLREGSWVEVQDEQMHLRGPLKARLFQAGQDAIELKPDSDLSLI